jgi:hypothetical protein
MKDNWIQNGTMIVHQNPDIAVAEWNKVFVNRSW